MMIHWCEICQSAPAEGVLEVINKADMERTYMQCCEECVNNLEDTDWIENAI